MLLIMKKSDDIQKDMAYMKFYNALVKIIDQKYNGNRKEVYETASISKSYFSEVMNLNKKASFPKQTAISKACGYNTVDEFIMKTSDQTPIEIQKIEQEHLKVIKQFKSKDLALKINQHLLELEQLDIIDFGRLAGEIVDRIESIKKRAKKNTA